MCMGVCTVPITCRTSLHTDTRCIALSRPFPTSKPTKKQTTTTRSAGFKESCVRTLSVPHCFRFLFWGGESGFCRIVESHRSTRKRRRLPPYAHNTPLARTVQYSPQSPFFISFLPTPHSPKGLAIRNVFLHDCGRRQTCAWATAKATTRGHTGTNAPSLRTKRQSL